MNRKIKFRGLALDPCSPPFWIYGYFSEVEAEGKKYLYIVWQGNTNQIYPNSECQFTGLKDKNGKEIYEGDIVDSWADMPEPYFREVIWNNCGLEFKPLTGYTLCKANESHFRVIGNIFENPELLEETR